VRPEGLGKFKKITSLGRISNSRHCFGISNQIIGLLLELNVLCYGSQLLLHARVGYLENGTLYIYILGSEQCSNKRALADQ
jgi:hypothetical protein